MSPSLPPAPQRPRALMALSTALVLGATAALAAPAATLAAQGDNEAVIGVIEQATPSVVTIQTDFTQVAEMTEPAPDASPAPEGQETPEDQQSQDFQLPEGFQLPDGAEMPQTWDDLQKLLPEGFQLPEGFEFPGGTDPFGGQGGFAIPGGSGSGVIITSDGLIITNGHVVGDATDVTVILDDGSILEGTVTGVDTLTDFAFVKVDAQDLPAITLGDSSGLRVGQMAISVGNPLGSFPGSAAVGIVSGLDRSIDAYGGFGGAERLNHLVQTDAAINSGNSGGALLDGDGKLIGITTAQAGMSDGIGFALPIDLAKPIIEQAKAGEPIERPYVGVLFREIDGQVAKDETLPVTAGAWVKGQEGGDSPIVADSPAAEAGLEDGDIITAVDGLAVDRVNPLDLQVLRFAPGDALTLDVLRDGETIQLPLTLGTRPADLGQ
jgi:S1-C subfamily serine protease